MNTKIFTLILCVLLSLSIALLSGCERARDIMSPTDTSTPSTLKVGLIHPEVNYVSFGKGAELARAEINQNGGVLGMQVEFIYRQETAETVVASATELVEEHNVVALVGPVFSTHAVKVAPVIQRPILPGATGANVTETGDFIFLVASPNALQAELMAEFAVNELGATTAAIIWQDLDVYSIGVVEAFDANFQQRGGSIVAKEVYKKGDTVFDMQLAAVQTANPDVLFLASFPPEVPLLMKQARDMKIQSVFIGGDGWEDPLMFDILADNAPLENSYYYTNFDPTAVEFISAYEAMFGIPADGIAASGYDAMRLLAMGIEAAQSTNPVAVRDAVAAITDYKGAVTISHFDEKRHPVKKTASVWQIVDGKPQAYSGLMSDSPEPTETP